MPTASKQRDPLCNKGDAEEMRDEIIAYWRRRDRDYKVWVETFSYRDGKGRLRFHYYIRSNITP